MLLLELVVQFVDFFDVRRVFNLLFDTIRKIFNFRHGKRQSRAFGGVFGFRRVGQTETFSDFIRLSCLNHGSNCGNVVNGLPLQCVGIQIFPRLCFQITSGIIFNFQFGFDFIADFREIGQRFGGFRIFLRSHSFDSHQGSDTAEIGRMLVLLFRHVHQICQFFMVGDKIVCLLLRKRGKIGINIGHELLFGCFRDTFFCFKFLFAVFILLHTR